MGADFQEAFYAVFALPITVMLACTLAGAVVLGLIRVIVGSMGFRRPWRPPEQ